MAGQLAERRHSVAWHLLWALGGFAASWLLLLVAFYLDVAVDALLPAEGVGRDLAVTLAQVAIVTAGLLALHRTARRRAQVSAAVWAGPAALAGYAWVAGFQAYVPGFYAPLVAPAVLTSALLAAWAVERGRPRKRGVSASADAQQR